jgi:hypothetical protein
MKNELWGFQGDCVFFKVLKEPEGFKKIKTNVLFEGETINHKHRIVEGTFELKEKDGVLFLCADTELKVEHEEHRTTTIQPGKYIVDRPREMDHLKNMERKTID